MPDPLAGQGPGLGPEHRPEQEPESDWKRRRRLAEVFGDVLPVTTSDEREDGDGGAGERSSEEWLKAQVPPHHG